MAHMEAERSSIFLGPRARAAQGAEGPSKAARLRCLADLTEG